MKKVKNFGRIKVEQEDEKFFYHGRLRSGYLVFLQGGNNRTRFISPETGKIVVSS